MDKLLFQDVSPEERLQMLKDNCENLLEDYNYDKPLSADQIRVIKDKISGAAVDLNDVQNEKKDADKQFNDRIKSIKSIIAENVKQLKERKTFACELCFQFIDYEEGMAYIYNKDGQLVEEPRMATQKELRGPKNMFRGQSTAKPRKEAANG